MTKWKIYLILLPLGPEFSCQVLSCNILSSVANEEEKFTTHLFVRISIKILIISACFWLQVFFSLLCSWQYIYKLINDMDIPGSKFKCELHVWWNASEVSQGSTHRDKRRRGARARACDPFSHILLILKDVQSSPVTRFVNTSLIADNMWFRFSFVNWSECVERKSSEWMRVRRKESGLSSYLWYFLVALHN